ncbi:helix-turn-helix domain-containing protein [Bacillus sp. JCM 19034]|uniref:helix-turn-helix domain-containing protein n=1 Tax=Bacillus sp. JCM 19034 TaxID=1481928 RepID=UPI000781BBF0|nr:helix-turn-helix transcriptional regulator [Bacillus sp. JCM 19034]
MDFSNKLKIEREKRGWSQEELAQKLFVSRQSVSKWENGKNYPNIEVIIELSNLFDITIDALLKNDEDLKEKIIQDSKQSTYLSWQSKVLFILGMIMAIILVSTIKYGETNWVSIGGTISGTLIFLIFLYFFSRNVKKK